MFSLLQPLLINFQLLGSQELFNQQSMFILCNLERVGFKFLKPQFLNDVFHTIFGKKKDERLSGWAQCNQRYYFLKPIGFNWGLILNGHLKQEPAEISFRLAKLCHIPSRQLRKELIKCFGSAKFFIWFSCYIHWTSLWKIQHDLQHVKSCSDTEHWQ